MNSDLGESILDTEILNNFEEILKKILNKIN